MRSAIVLAVLLAPPAHAGDWFVDASAPPGGSGTRVAPFSRVGAAIAVAAAGDTILVQPGTYGERIQIKRPLTLVGTGGAAVTVLDGNGAGTVVKITTPGVSITGFTITGGRISGKGGGVEVTAIFGAAALRECVIRNCQADNGGGLYAWKDSTVTLSRCRVERNQVRLSGGGVMSLGTLLLEDTAVAGNVASGTSLNGNGGGIFAVRLTMLRCDVARNLGTQYGGGIFVSGNTIIDQCTIRDNFLDFDYWTLLADGGGLYAFRCSVAMTGTVVSGNVCLGGRGAGIGLDAAKVSAVDCVFEDNDARRYGTLKSLGGGIWWGNGTQRALTLWNCRVTGNRAYDGGGFGTDDATAPGVSLVRTVITGNTASSRGGGVLGGDLLLRHCTVARNRAGTGGGVNGDVQLTHTILAANNAAAGPNAYGAVTSLGYNLFDNTKGFVVLGNLQGNITGVRPRFVDPKNGDFDLLPTSPCIDAGDPTLVLAGLDAADRPRLLDGNLDRRMVPDMGAYEYDAVRLVLEDPDAVAWKLQVRGPPGMRGFLWVGERRGELPFAPYGSLLLDLAAHWTLVDLGGLPFRATLAPPPGLDLARTLQALGVDPVTGAGNLSNVLDLRTR